MRLGVISDIHANLPAFEAVIDDMPSVDRFVCAGDIVGYNPWPAECVDRVRDEEILTVQGNHDRAVAGGGRFDFNSMAGAGVEYARERLADDAIGWLGRLPERRRIADDRALIAHGHPTQPDRYTYPDEFSAALLEGADLLVLGHTHVQGHRRFDEGVVLNPGSVGQPRDGDPRAAYAVVDLDDLAVEERRVCYDVERVVEAVAAAGLPSRIGSRLRKGR
ncbi:metallophosphoesterase family protein [Haloferacaceae archaeon DSL9]